MSIKKKKFTRLRKELQFLISELDYIHEVLDEWHGKFDEYQHQYCSENNIDLRHLQKKNSKRVEQIIPQSIKPSSGTVDFSGYKNKNKIKKIYKQMARILHPDLGGDEKEFQEMNAAIKEKNYEKIFDICDKHEIDIEIDNDILKALSEQIEETKKKISKEKSTYSWGFYECEESKNCKDNIIKKFLKQLFNYEEKK
jgi:hypothetical protein